MKEPDKEHLLYCLAEECAEVIQALMKRKRFDKNMTYVHAEVNDLFAILEMLQLKPNETAVRHKQDKVRYYYNESIR